MIDIILLRIMKHRDQYQMLRPMVHPENFSKETAALIGDFARYFEQFPSHASVEVTTFMTRFPGWHPGITDEKVREYARVIQNVMQDADQDQKDVILQELADRDISLQLANTIAEYGEGEVSDLYGKLSQHMDAYKRSRNLKQIKYIDTPIKELLKADTAGDGVRWRLHVLNEAMRPLRGGDFGIIAARPDQGKTSFIASEVTYMAPQIPDERNVLWLNNEGLGKRIIPRYWQAALGYTINEMVALDREDKLEEQFLKLMKRFDKIRVVDIHGLNNSQVEMIVDQNNAHVVVYDMIDNVNGFGDASRTDQKLEQMYQWGRNLSVKYEHIGLATSQISVEGDGLMYPTMSMLKDSKTGKQGACDFQLMIGSSNDPNMRSSRFISLPKNKMHKPDGTKDPRAEVLFDALRSRFIDHKIDPQTGV